MKKIISLIKNTILVSLCVTGLSYGAITSVSSTGGVLGNIVISTTVLDACTISVPDLTFPNYDPSSATPTSQTATIDYQCTDGSIPILAIDQATLQMSFSGNNISYTLHKGASSSDPVWTSVSNYSLPAATGGSDSTSYSGEISTGQFVPAGGPYTQTLQITLSF